MKEWIRDLLAKDVKKMDIKEVVDDSGWQTLRKSFIGTWKKTPNENVKKLREYLGDFSNALKLRKVHNYLVGSAFRMGIIDSPEIRKLRDEVCKKRKELEEKEG